MAPHFKELRSDIASDIVKEVESGRMLEIGVGAGYLLTEIAGRLPSVKITGIDISQDMVNTARKNVSKKGFAERIELRCMDANKMDFKNNSFDFVFSMLAYHHFKNPVNVLNEIHRVLKKGREAWIYDGHAGIPCERIREVRKKYFFPFNILAAFLIRSILILFAWTMSLHGVRKKEVFDALKNSKFKEYRVKEFGLLLKIVARK